MSSLQILSFLITDFLLEASIFQVLIFSLLLNHLFAKIVEFLN
jgi:hypothetical protein